jgi:hypothetical protein
VFYANKSIITPVLIAVPKAKFFNNLLIAFIAFTRPLAAALRSDKTGDHTFRAAVIYLICIYRRTNMQKTTNKASASPTTTANNVAKKDAAKQQLTSATVIERADALFKDRERFEGAELARSNKALYKLLTQVYELFEAARADLQCLKAALKTMSDKLKERGIKIQSNTPALTVFVRYVFNSDRKRAYAYTQTLMAAIQKEIKPAGLASFIESQNGVEECRKQLVKKDETVAKEEALKAASTDVYDTLKSMRAATTVTLPQASVSFSDGAEFAFIVARSLGNGEFELLRAVPHSTKAMHASAVKELAKDLIVKRAAADEKAKKDAVDDSINEAANGASRKVNPGATLKELQAA